MAVPAEYPIIDAHHHLWDEPPALGKKVERPYIIDDLAADVADGHTIVATVYVECGSHYRKQGPEHLRPLGETEWVLDQVRDQPLSGLCAGIVGYADLSLGDQVAEVLEAHIALSEGRIRGVRQSAARDDDPVFDRLPHKPAAGLLANPAFHRGFQRLQSLGLVFDAMLFHPQLNELVELARAFPETAIVIDHVGGFIGIGEYSKRRDAEIAAWRADLETLADCPNLVMKIGGMGMFLGGSPLLHRETDPSVKEIAADWAPFIHYAIDCFGPGRCMFESNYPVDGATCSYRRLWDVFKELAKDYSETEQQALFSGVASRVYSIPVCGSQN